MKFISRIQRLIKWLPLLWQDEPWDHAYLVRIILFKLHDMGEYMETGPYLNEEEYDKILITLTEAYRCLKEFEDDWSPYMDGLDDCSTAPMNPEWLNTQRFDMLAAKHLKYKQNNLKRFCHLFENHLQEWWD